MALHIIRILPSMPTLNAGSNTLQNTIMSQEREINHMNENKTILYKLTNDSGNNIN